MFFLKYALNRFIAAVAMFIALCFAIAFTKNESWLTAWFILLILVALPVFILTWIELGRAIRNAPSPSRKLRILGILFGLPQAFFGLLSLVSGISIIVWVLYNSFVARQPEYTGGFLSFGVGPVLTLFGLYLIRDAFARYNKTTEPHQAASIDVVLKRRLLKFIVSIIFVLLIAAGITYKYGVPLLENSKASCSAGGARNYGCGTGFGQFLTIVIAAVAVMIAWLWRKFGDD